FRGALSETFAEELLSYQMQDRPVHHISLLRERAQKDIAILEQHLRAQGYFSAQVQYTLQTTPQGLVLLFDVQPGDAFILEEIQLLEANTQEFLPLLVSLTRKFANRRNTLALLTQIEQKALGRLKKKGFPMATLKNKELIVDHTQKKTKFQCLIDPGPRVFFGPITFVGADTLPTIFLRNRVTFQEGALFDAREIEATRQALIATKLFSSVKIEVAQRADKHSLLPVKIRVRMVPSHLLSLGGLFSTYKAAADRDWWRCIKGKVSLTKFNPFRCGDQMRVSLSGSPPTYTSLHGEGTTRYNFAVEGDLMEPDVFSAGYTLITRGTFLQETTIGFFRYGFAAEALLDIPLKTILRFTIGPTIESFRVEGQGVHLYNLVGFSSEVVLDTTDSVLNPKKGIHLSLELHPQGGSIMQPDKSTQRGLCLTKGRFLVYCPFDQAGNYVIAGWANLRQVLWQKFTHIPTDKRLYAGGNHSVRGYALQYAGPLDAAQQHPIGGRSVLEGGGELRLHLVGQLFGAFFIESAKVSQGFFPSLAHGWFTGLGLGFCYLTEMGPLRVDIARPLRIRPKIDAKCQVMISIGQAL
ncbi:MAG: BamA/TamA family outer membrane protein, partial [Holosporales bacterium]|nr:BamA/TamA family outer membrane protein [Holosporales bacterium]